MTDAARGTGYMAFISYRHADNKEEDRQWATWLHQQLEVYDIPAELIGTVNTRGEVIPERIYPVFRDEVSLPADADLSSAIRQALDESQFLIVLCSPRAVQSTYLCEEIVHFKARGNAHRIIAGLLLGEPNASIDPGKEEDPEDARTLECFPRPLQYEVTTDGELDEGAPTEPLAADFRLPDGGKGLTNPTVYKQQLLESGHHAAEAERLTRAYEEKLSTAKLKIIAGILGVRLDTLTARDKVYQLAQERAKTRRAWRLGGAMGALFLAAAAGGLFAWLQYQEAEGERARAETLLSSVRQNLTFMNFDLRDVLQRYVPTGPRVEVMQRIDSIVEALEAHGSAADMRDVATAKLQKADLILRSDTQDPERALPLLNEALEGFQKLVELDPGNTQFQRDVSVSYNKLGDIQLRVGDTDAALANYNKALEVRLKLVELDPGNTEFQRDVSGSHNSLGDIQLHQGNTDAALDNFEKALEVRLELVRRNPDNAQFQRDVSVSHSRIGDIYSRLGETVSALANYEKALEVALKLAELDRSDTQFRRDLSMSYNDLGEVNLRLGNIEPALENYNKALEARLELLRFDPDNTEFGRDVSVSYDHLGDIQLRLGDISSASRHYKQALEGFRKLVELDSRNTKFRRDVALTYDRLSVAQLLSGNTDAALANSNMALGEQLKLLEIDPDNIEIQRDISASYSRLGDIQLRLGNADAALANYERAVDITSTLVERDPGNAQFQHDLVLCNVQLAELFELQRDTSRAALHFRLAQDLIERMAFEGMLAPDDRWLIEELKQRVANSEAKESSAHERRPMTQWPP